MGIDKSFNLKGNILPNWFTRYFPGQNIGNVIKGIQASDQLGGGGGNGNAESDYEKSLRSQFNLDPSQIFSLQSLRPHLTAQDAHIAKQLISQSMEWGSKNSQNLPVPGNETDITKYKGTNLILNQPQIGNIYQPGGQPEQFKDFNQRFQKSLSITAPHTNWNQGMWLHSIAIGRNSIYGDDEINPLAKRSFQSIVSANLAQQKKASHSYINKDRVMNVITHQIKTQISVPFDQKIKRTFSSAAHNANKKYMGQLKGLQVFKRQAVDRM